MQKRWWAEGCERHGPKEHLVPSGRTSLWASGQHAACHTPLLSSLFLFLNFYFLYFTLFSGLHCAVCEILSFPDQGSNPCPLHWKHRAPTTRIARKSSCFFSNITFSQRQSSEWIDDPFSLPMTSQARTLLIRDDFFSAFPCLPPQFKVRAFSFLAGSTAKSLSAVFLASDLLAFPSILHTNNSLISLKY